MHTHKDIHVCICIDMYVYVYKNGASRIKNSIDWLPLLFETQETMLFTWNFSGRRLYLVRVNSEVLKDSDKNVFVCL